MAVRLRYQIDTLRRLRAHVHVVDRAGYFFFPGAEASPGAPAWLQITFTATDQTALLRGQVWARPVGGGVWLELPGVGARLDRLFSAPRREELRLATEQMVLLEADGFAAMLCRLRDVSERGARLAAGVGLPGSGVRVALAEAGQGGNQLEAAGRVAWAGEGEMGVAWDRGDFASRAAIRRLQQIAEEEWEGARSSAHPRTCRCLGRERARPDLLLLG